MIIKKLNKTSLISWEEENKDKGAQIVIKETTTGCYVAYIDGIRYENFSPAEGIVDGSSPLDALKNLCKKVSFEEFCFPDSDKPEQFRYMHIPDAYMIYTNMNSCIDTTEMYTTYKVHSKKKD